MPDPVRIEPPRDRGGEWVTIGSEQYRIPPLSFRQLQNLGDVMGPLRVPVAGVPSKEQTDAMVKVILWAMNRNYPNLTADDLCDMLDLGNFLTVFEAVMSVAGLRKEKAQEAPSGEQ